MCIGSYRSIFAGLLFPVLVVKHHPGWLALCTRNNVPTFLEVAVVGLNKGIDAVFGIERNRHESIGILGDNTWLGADGATIGIGIGGCYTVGHGQYRVGV